VPGSGERVLWRGKPALRAFWPLYFCAFLALLCSIPWPVLFLVSVPFALLAHSLAVLLRRATDYLVTNRRVRREFRFWITRAKEVWLDKRTDVLVRQDAVQRALGIGDVWVFTPFAFGGVRLWGLEEFDRVHRLISGR